MNDSIGNSQPLARQFRKERGFQLAVLSGGAPMTRRSGPGSARSAAAGINSGMMRLRQAAQLPCIPVNLAGYLPGFWASKNTTAVRAGTENVPVRQS